MIEIKINGKTVIREHNDTTLYGDVYLPSIQELHLYIVLEDLEARFNTTYASLAKTVFGLNINEIKAQNIGIFTKDDANNRFTISVNYTNDTGSPQTVYYIVSVDAGSGKICTIYKITANNVLNPFDTLSINYTIDYSRTVLNLSQNTESFQTYTYENKNAVLPIHVFPQYRLYKYDRWIVKNTDEFGYDSTYVQNINSVVNITSIDSLDPEKKVFKSLNDYIPSLSNITQNRYSSQVLGELIFKFTSNGGVGVATARRYLRLVKYDSTNQYYQFFNGGNYTLFLIRRDYTNNTSQIVKKPNHLIEKQYDDFIREYIKSYRKVLNVKPIKDYYGTLYGFLNNGTYSVSYFKTDDSGKIITYQTAGSYEIYQINADGSTTRVSTNSTIYTLLEEILTPNTEYFIKALYNISRIYGAVVPSYLHVDNGKYLGYLGFTGTEEVKLLGYNDLLQFDTLQDIPTGITITGMCFRQHNPNGEIIVELNEDFYLPVKTPSGAYYILDIGWNSYVVYDKLNDCIVVLPVSNELPPKRLYVLSIDSVNNEIIGKKASYIYQDSLFSTLKPLNARYKSEDEYIIAFLKNASTGEVTWTVMRKEEYDLLPAQITIGTDTYLVEWEINQTEQIENLTITFDSTTTSFVAGEFLSIPVVDNDNVSIIDSLESATVRISDQSVEISEYNRVIENSLGYTNIHDSNILKESKDTRRISVGESEILPYRWNLTDDNWLIFKYYTVVNQDTKLIHLRIPKVINKDGITYVIDLRDIIITDGLKTLSWGIFNPLTRSVEILSKREDLNTSLTNEEIDFLYDLFRNDYDYYHIIIPAVQYSPPIVSYTSKDIANTNYDKKIDLFVYVRKKTWNDLLPYTVDVENILGMDTSDNRIGIIHLPFAIPNTAIIKNQDINKNQNYRYTMFNPFTGEELEYDNVIFVEFNDLKRNPNFLTNSHIEISIYGTGNNFISFSRNSFSRLGYSYTDKVLTCLFDNYIPYPYYASNNLAINLDDAFGRLVIGETSTAFFDYFTIQIRFNTAVSPIQPADEYEATSYNTIDGLTINKILEYTDTIVIENGTVKNSVSPSQLFDFSYSGFEIEPTQHFNIVLTDPNATPTVNFTTIGYSVSGTSTFIVRYDSLNNIFTASPLTIAYLFYTSPFNEISNFYLDIGGTLIVDTGFITKNNPYIIVAGIDEIGVLPSSSPLNSLNFSYITTVFKPMNDDKYIKTFSGFLGATSYKMSFTYSYTSLITQYHYLHTLVIFKNVPIRNQNAYFKMIDYIPSILPYKYYHISQKIYTEAIFEDIIDNSKITKTKFVITTREFLQPVIFSTSTSTYVIKDNQYGIDLKTLKGVTSLPYFKIYTYFDDANDIKANSLNQDVLVFPKGFIKPFINTEYIRSLGGSNAIHLTLASLNKNVPTDYEFYAVVDRQFIEELTGVAIDNLAIDYEYVVDTFTKDISDNLANYVSSTPTGKILIKNQLFRYKHLNFSDYFPVVYSRPKYLYDANIGYLVFSGQYDRLNEGRWPIFRYYIPLNQTETCDVSGEVWATRISSYINAGRYLNKYQERVGTFNNSFATRVMCARANFFASVIGEKILYTDTYTNVHRIPAITSIDSTYNTTLGIKMIKNAYDYFNLNFTGVNNFTYTDQNLTDSTNLVFSLVGGTANQNNITLQPSKEVIYTKYVDICGADGVNIVRTTSPIYFTKPIKIQDIVNLYRIDPVYVSTHPIKYYLVLRVYDPLDEVNTERFFALTKDGLKDITEDIRTNYFGVSDVVNKYIQLSQLIDLHNLADNPYNIEELLYQLKLFVPETYNVQFGIVFRLIYTAEQYGFDAKFYGINLFADINDINGTYYKYIKYTYYDSITGSPVQYGSGDSIILEAIPTTYYVIEEVATNTESTYDDIYINGILTDAFLSQHDKPLSYVLPTETMLNGGYVFFKVII